MNAVKFSGTFIIRTDDNLGREQLARTVNPDYLEGDNYKRPGLFEHPAKFLVLRNENPEKDKKVIDWMNGQGIATWSQYNPVMVSETAALKMLKI